MCNHGSVAEPLLSTSACLPARLPALNLGRGTEPVGASRPPSHSHSPDQVCQTGQAPCSTQHMVPTPPFSHPAFIRTLKWLMEGPWLQPAAAGEAGGGQWFSQIGVLGPGQARVWA